MNSSYQRTTTFQKSVFSVYLNREVILSIILPQDFSQSRSYKLLLMNDGQDFPALRIEDMLNEMQQNHLIEPVAAVGIHANADRLFEYGTSVQSDYANRGHKAKDTRDFVLNELIPFLKESYNVQDDQVVYGGFSLGGLMALDIAWNHSEIFSKAAVFSGALWWRKKAIEDGYNDADRIMHAQIRETSTKPDLKFWFQCGGKDETDDRDGDGVIDSIQDTLECISELERKGYIWNKDIHYLEMPDGEHHIATWSEAFPEFLVWAFGVE